MTEPDFWDWAVRAYAGDGIAARCLELQDTHAQNVPLILFAIWAATRGVALDEETAEAAVDISRAYADSVVEPLRAVRRRLKGPVGDMETPHREALRAGVKALELEAERIQMAELAALVTKGDAQDVPARARDNMIAVCRLWARIVPRNPLIGLCDALSEGGFLSYNV